MNGGQSICFNLDDTVETAAVKAQVWWTNSDHNTGLMRLVNFISVFSGRNNMTTLTDTLASSGLVNGDQIGFRLYAQACPLP
jgi:hypothetical protein